MYILVLEVSQWKQWKQKCRLQTSWSIVNFFCVCVIATTASDNFYVTDSGRNIHNKVSFTLCFFTFADFRLPAKISNDFTTLCNQQDWCDRKNKTNHAQIKFWLLFDWCIINNYYNKLKESQVFDGLWLYLCRYSWPPEDKSTDFDPLIHYVGLPPPAGKKYVIDWHQS